MYTCVSSTRACHGNDIIRHDHQRILDFTLNGSIRGLSLPSVIGAAIVFNGNFKVWHETFGLESVAGDIPKLAFENVIHRIGEFAERILDVTEPATQINPLSRFLNHQALVTIGAFGVSFIHILSLLRCYLI